MKLNVIAKLSFKTPYPRFSLNLSRRLGKIAGRMMAYKEFFRSSVKIEIDIRLLTTHLSQFDIIFFLECVILSKAHSLDDP